MKLILEKKDKIKIVLITTIIILIESIISYNQTANIKKVSSNLNEIYTDRLIAQNYLLKLNDLIHHQKELTSIEKPNEYTFNTFTKNGKEILAYINKFEATYLIKSELLLFEKTKLQAHQLFNNDYYNNTNVFTNKHTNINFKIKLDWRPFTHVEGIKALDFRKQKIYIEQYACVIFTSRIAIEQYFRICEELRIKISEENKYFCISEAIALYLQKFIQYRKRKVFFGDGKLPKLMEVILKHKENGKFLLPCSDVRDKALAEALNKYNIEYSEAFIYKTVASDLSDLSDVKYDMLVFFNPSAIDSLYTNFPKFSQDETRLAIFGNTTADAVKAHKLNINVFAPTPENPSLVDAIKKYITEANKKR